MQEAQAWRGAPAWCCEFQAATALLLAYKIADIRIQCALLLWQRISELRSPTTPHHTAQRQGLIAAQTLCCQALAAVAHSGRLTTVATTPATPSATPTSRIVVVSSAPCGNRTEGRQRRIYSPLAALQREVPNNKMRHAIGCPVQEQRYCPGHAVCAHNPATKNRPILPFLALQAAPGCSPFPTHLIKATAYCSMSCAAAKGVSPVGRVLWYSPGILQCPGKASLPVC